MHHLLYHANCADGFAAACIARHALKDTGELNLQPINYGWEKQLPVGLSENDQITYLDYTPPAEALAELRARMQFMRLTIIDHHSTAADRHGRDKTGQPLEGTAGTPARFESVFNLNASGAELAWEHFMNGQPIPRAIELIAWRDLGAAFDPALADDPSTPDSLNLHAYLFRCLPRTFDAWTPLLLEGRADTLVRSAIQTGARLREIDRSLIKTAADFPHWLNFHGEEIPAVNGLDAGLVSDACTALLRAYPTAPFAASWFIDPKSGNATYSLRSRRDSTVNVAEIAKAFHPGGGGHPNAAGFSTPIPIPFV